MGSEKESDDDVKKDDSAKFEDDPEILYRIYGVLCYFVVLVVIGIPIWWYTTRVYRASLPLDEMYNFTFPEPTDKQLGIPLSLEYDVLITIVNPDPGSLEVNINGEDVETYLQPFLGKISPIANFTVKSQWLYLVELGAIPRKVTDHYALSEEQLPHIITPLEKKLWSHLSPRPCLNLVLYISPCNVPLYIYDKYGQKSPTNAFFSPKWGGIFILNPSAESCEQKTFEPDLQLVSSTFITQLMHLLNMDGTSEEHLTSLYQQKTTEMLDSSKRTLKSLAQLLSEINSIVISDDVALKIKVAVDSVKLAEESGKEMGVEKCLKLAKIAYENAEAAFSDPSLLALLYFPDDQKYAVYIPLFLPVMIPVFMSLITVKKWYSGVKAAKVKVE